MAERREVAPQYPLTADLAGVLAAARQERADDMRRFFARLFRAGLSSRWKAWRLQDRVGWPGQARPSRHRNNCDT